jgi:hypothetical protein
MRRVEQSDLTTLMSRLIELRQRASESGQARLFRKLDITASRLQDALDQWERDEEQNRVKQAKSSLG